MKKQIIAATAAVLLLSAPTTARAPTKPQEIEGFEPVTIAGLVVRDYWSTPRPTMGNRPSVEIETSAPIILNLTEPGAYGHTVDEAKRYALDKLGSVQYSCIDKIFTQESHWNPFARNKYSGAYGIPQALPGDKMAKFGADWRTNPITQVKWGINYVNVRYGSACKAWEFKKVHGWY